MKAIFLPFITIVMAFVVALCAAYFSIFGLVLIFSGATIAVIAMASALEISKLVMTSVLFNYYKSLPFLVTLYSTLAIFVLMVITSAGIYGFLSAAYQQSQAPLVDLTHKLQLAEEEHERKVARLKQMDDVVAGIAANFVTKRLEEKKQQAPEREELRVRINELEQNIRTYTESKLNTEVHIGPIIKIAEAFNVPRDYAAHLLILLFVFVFDPLAVIMTLCFNVMIRSNRDEAITIVPPTNHAIVPTLPVDLNQSTPVSNPNVVASVVTDPPSIIIDSVTASEVGEIEIMESSIEPAELVSADATAVDNSSVVSELGNELDRIRKMIEGGQVVPVHGKASLRDQLITNIQHGKLLD